MPTHPRSREAELRVVSMRLDSAPAEEIVRWAVIEFGDGLTLAASTQDCVLIDIVTRVDPGIDVVFLDIRFLLDDRFGVLSNPAMMYAECSDRYGRDGGDSTSATQD